MKTSRYFAMFFIKHKITDNMFFIKHKGRYHVFHKTQDKDNIFFEGQDSMLYQKKGKKILHTFEKNDVFLRTNCVRV